ncbi:SWI/SNF-related matrix-associated actin-dependent regulator of chromatin subfamily A containing DEAD/H box 1 homolog isoform X1 [Macrobrachium rosenbergii]|uniref:SWI/SNF-related matrix-associated actin-dependent regulator of chromatin subfamily A containing DEAD/H box 1 homolog isoform X1 n=2 Tax=Macrobrachium rosenbergii TaxID=79674 RepID=UPI0034D41140
MENVNGVSSTSSISPEPCSKAPLAKGLRNFRMDKESATKGQLSLLRYFRSEPRKSGKSSDKVPEQLKTEESSPTDDTDAATVSVHHKVSVDVEKPSVKVEKKNPTLVTTTLVNKPSSTISYRHTVVESQSDTVRNNSLQSSMADSDSETICSQQSVENSCNNTGPEESSSPVFKRKLLDRESSLNGDAEDSSDHSSSFVTGSSGGSSIKAKLSSYRMPSKLLYVKPPSSDPEDSNSGKEDNSQNPLGGASMKSLIEYSSFKKSSFTDTEQDSQDSPIYQARVPKRARVIDSDEDNDSDPPSKRVHTNGHSGSSDEGSEMPDDETIQKFIEMWESVYPHVDKLEAMDAFKDHNWEVKETMLYLGKLNTQRKNQNKIKNLEEMLARKREIAERKKEEKTMRKREVTEKKEELKKQREAVKQMESAERAAQREKLRAQKAILKAKAAMKSEAQDVEEDEDEYNFGSSKVYDSEEDSDTEPDMTLTPDRALVLSFFNDGTVGELSAISGCNKKKAELIIQNRPFADWQDIVYKFQTMKSVSTDLLNQAKSILHVRRTVQQLMKKCEKIAKDMQSIVSRIVSGEEDAGISEQPESLNPEMKLKSYQLIGLNWLVLMHEQGLNGVLADEMGLGKTVQAISFLAYIKDTEEPDNISVIIVPSSTLENWARELELWCPSLVVLQYHGTQEERRGMRIAIVNDDLEEVPDVILTTYNMVTSSAEDRALFKKLRFNIVILDEAHMLKNMASQRYEQLMKIKGERRVLLTGTPLQNNLVELMSLLIFVMPQLFDSKRDELKRVFAMFPKGEESSKNKFERERIEQAKRIMKPFFLRRLKNDVLKDLPPKHDRVIHAPLAERQQRLYSETVDILSRKAQQNKINLEEITLQRLSEIEELEATADFSGKGKKDGKQVDSDTSSNMVMTLRKIANHPLLVRSYYDSSKIKAIAKVLKKTTHRDSVEDYIVEDLSVMSDFQIHKTCLTYYPIKDYCLKDEQLLHSGKFEQLDALLPELKEKGSRVLIFSQFVIVLDILEQYLKIRGHKFVRIDGSTQVADRQMLIDLFSDNEHLFIFLLSTRAGGLGINLTAANTVILHDIDFNPYNDKQAEDRCHRVGQTKPVEVIRLVSKGSIEEGMLQIAQDKLQLEKDVTGHGEEQQKKGDLVSLLKAALGLGKVEASGSTKNADGEHNQSGDSAKERVECSEQDLSEGEGE